MCWSRMSRCGRQRRTDWYHGIIALVPQQARWPGRLTMQNPCVSLPHCPGELIVQVVCIPFSPDRENPLTYWNLTRRLWHKEHETDHDCVPFLSLHNHGSWTEHLEALQYQQTGMRSPAFWDLGTNHKDFGNTLRCLTMRLHLNKSLPFQQKPISGFTSIFITATHPRYFHFDLILDLLLWC
jgi:hypothetical protein